MLCALRLKAHLQDNQRFESKTPEQIHAALKEFVKEEIHSGRLSLTAIHNPPWMVAEIFLHACGVPLVLLVLRPFLIFYLPIFIYQLRSREKPIWKLLRAVDLTHERKLARLEDHDVTNQFTAIGTMKPGLFRRWTLTFLLWVLDWTTRHIFNRGHLARVPTIHAARWAFLDQKKRLVFASSYDGSLQSYMDDFINKVGWGLNLVFSNGIGYPRTKWLVLDGAKNEEKFKYFIRRHQLPTEVWYKAYSRPDRI